MKSNNRSRILYALIATLALIVWTRTAAVDAAFWTLTDNEIPMLSNAGAQVNRDETSLATRTGDGEVPCTPTLTGLVSWWSADGNALESRSRNNGALQNGAAFGAGHVGQAFSFDGNNDFAEAPDSPNLDVQQFTAEAWVFPTSDISGGADDSLSFIVAKESATSNQYEIGRKNNTPCFSGNGIPTGNFAFHIQGLTGLPNDCSDFVNGNAFLPLNTWSHVALTYDGANVRAYHNGVLTRTVAATGTIPDTTGSLQIGGRIRGNTSFWAGQIDEVSIYDRALSTSEIQSISNAGTAGKCKPTATTAPGGLVGWWAGDGNPLDTSGSFNHATLLSAGGYAVGNVGQTFSFNGTVTSGATIPHNTLYDVNSPGFTGEFWMKSNGAQSGRAAILEKSHGFVDSTGWVFQSNNTPSDIGFFLGGGGGGIVNFIGVASTVNPFDGNYHHVAGTWDGANIRLYVDSVLQGTTPFTTPVNNARAVNIGYAWGGGSGTRSFNGRVDESSIYNRALSQDEITSIFNAGLAGKLKAVATPPNVAVVGDATVTFGSVTTAGTTQQIPLDPALLPALPIGTHTGLSYDIATSAVFTGSPTVCFNLPSFTSTQFANLRVLHLEDGAWVDRTATSNTSPTLCTEGLTSLSPFAIVSIPTNVACPVGQKIWDGGGTTNNWSEAANWCDDTVPGSTAIFNGTSTKNAIIDISLDLGGSLQILSGYTGTISMAPGVNVTFGDSTASTISSGTFTAGSGTLIFGSPSVGGGLNLSNSGTFTAGSGPITFRSVFNQIGGTFNGGSGDVSGAFEITGGTFNAPSGNLTTSAEGGKFKPTSFHHGNGTFVFTGGNANFEVLTLLELNNLTINKNEAGTLNLFENNRTVRVAGTLSLVEGRLSGGSGTVIKSEGPVNIGANFGSANSAVGGGGVILLKDGSGPRAIDWPSTASLPHIRVDDPNVTLTVSGAGTALSGSIHILNGAFEAGSTNLAIGHNSSTIAGYLQSGGTFHIGSGNLTQVTGTFQLSGGMFTMDSGNATFPCFLTVNIAGGTFNASSATSGTTTFCTSGDFNGSFTQSAGVFNGGNGTLDINHNFTLTGGTFNASSGNTHFGFVYNHSGGTFSTQNGGTVIFDSIHTGYSINAPGTDTFHNLTFNPAGGIGLSGDTFVANGTLRLMNGVVNGGALHAKGNVIVESTADGGNASLTFNGDASQTFTNNGGPSTTGTWTVNKPVGTTVTAATSMLLGTSPLNVTAGTLYLGNGSNLTVGALNIAASGKLVNDSSTTITLGANAINNGMLDLQGGGAACPEADTIFLRSSVDGMQRNWSGTTGAYRIVDVDVKDMGVNVPPPTPPSITVYSGTNSGNNHSNWNFAPPTPCPPDLTISPLTANVVTNGMQQFMAGGGFEPRTFSVPTNNGSINASSGLYTAGNTAGVTDTVRVTDAFGSTADAMVTIVGPPTRVAFATQPSNTTAGQNITPAIQVAIQDEFGNTVPNATNTVTLTIQDNPGSGTLSGTVTRDAVMGIATFNDLSIDRAATGYTLQATSPSLTAATSASFNINVGAPSQLSFLVQPSDVGLNAAITPAVEVEIQDVGGNRVTSATNAVTMMIGTNPGGGTLSGTLTRDAVAGVASFNDLSINTGGVGYTLAASSSGLTSDVSGAFNVIDSFQVTNTNDAGAGSLRQAIINSNDTAGVQTISFNIPPPGPHTITISSLHLPTITDPVVIDGTTQPGYAGAPIVKIRGIVQLGQGLTITAGNTTVKGLVLDHFQQAISIYQNGGNIIEGNYIGTDTSGNSEGEPSYGGIFIQSSSGNRIGGNTVAARNVISGNTGTGVLIFASNDTLIQGNYIGTNAAGAGDVGNGTGVYLSSTENTVIGGDTAGTRNLISGNSAGLTIWNPIQPSPSGNFVKGNYIGTDATGTAAIPNDNWGIWLTDTSNVTVGGTQAGEGNLISGNTAQGILVSNWNRMTILMSNLVIKGNLIGTNAAGTGAIPNGAGIFLRPYTVNPSTIGISNLTIGGPEPGARNVISGNVGAGIALTQWGLTDLSIKGNHIGADAAGTAGLPNYSGIALYGSTGSNSDLYIGGIGPGEGNLIAFNTTLAVHLGSAMRSVTARGNSIHSNLAYWNPALSLSPSPNSNDPCDGDMGANNRQNYPELTALLSSGGSTTIDGSLSSEPNKTYTIDFYSNESCGLLGLGQGKTYLGSTTVTTGAVCAFPASTPFSATFPVTVPAGHQVMATATDPDGNTSEFSRCLGPSAKIEGTILDSNSQPLRSVYIQANDLGDGTTRYASTNASGRFTVGGLPLGRNYRIRPTKQSYTFTPSSRTYNDLSANQDDPYTGNGTLTISGQVTRTAQTSSLVPNPAPIGPFPLGGVTITLTGPTNQTVVTTTDGNYQLHNLLPGTYTITPSKLNHTFTPPSTMLTISTNAIANFTAQSVGLDGLTGRFMFDSAGDIKAMNADGSGLVTIIPRTRSRTGPQYDHRYPSLSKDGSKLVYTRHEVGTANSEIWTSAPDGGNRTMVRSGITTFAGTTFSPDGSRIAFFEGSGTAQGLWVMNSDGTNAVRLLTDCRVPDWSADGLKLVFTCNNPAQIYMANADGSNFTPFYAPGAGIRAFFSAWSPDGTKIAIARRIQSTGTSQIFLKDVTSGVETVIASSTSVDYNGYLGWSPDGNWISARALPQTVNQIPKLIAVSSDGSHQLMISDPAPGLFIRWGATNSQPTPAGNNVAVQTGNISVTIQTVSGAGGITTVTPIPPAAAGQVPGGFVVGGQAYEISTTANFTPPVTVCFTTQAAISLGAFSQLSLMHNEGGVLVDRTTSRTYSVRRICGQVSSFSPFVLAQLIDPSLPEISGIVVDSNGVPLADISIALTGDEEYFAKTDFNGEFIFPNLVSGGNYELTPTEAGYTYFLPYQLYPNITGSQATVFVAIPASFDISGTVRDTNQQPMAGITVNLTGADDKSTVTDANGNYSFVGLPADTSYSVAPSSAQFQFNPVDTLVGPLFADVAGVDFARALAPTAAMVSVSGQVTTADGRGINGAVITIEGGDLPEPMRARTNGFGYYRLDNLLVGETYVLTISSKRYTFNPPTLVITLVDEVTDADWIGAE